MKFIPYGRQSIDSSDIKEVVRVLKSDWITQGPKIREFESALCEYAGAMYAVAVCNGTAALHIASLAAGIKRGDEVITSPVTFVASANCVLYCWGKPVFADIQAGVPNIDPAQILKKINKKTKGIIPVHFSGYPCDIEEIRRIANKYNLFIIEDACHALGANYKGSKIGSCKYSDLTVFSFHPVKSITTGEGGAILTNRKDLYEKLLMLRNHGITKDERFLKENPGPWHYEMQSLGFNYRITDIQAALGISQLRKLDSFIAKRRKITAIYNNAFSGRDWIRPLINEDKAHSSAYHLYAVAIDFKKIKKTRKQVMDYLRKNNIGTQVHYIPVYRHPYYRKNFNYSFLGYPNAEKYYEIALTLPLYTAMTNSDSDYVIKKVLELRRKESE